MAIRTLSVILDVLKGGQGAQAIRADGGSIPTSDRNGVESGAIQRASIVSVDAVSGASVQIGAQTFSATQATDEPLRAGSEAWVSRAVDGTYVIHGSAV